MIKKELVYLAVFLNRLCVSFLIFLIQIYRRCISPALGSHCRFYPSCSQYGLDALKKYGTGKGIVKTAWRICKCHPFHKGGVDYP